jgi:hypothetical protein
MPCWISLWPGIAGSPDPVRLIPEEDFFERVMDFVYPNQTLVEAVRLADKEIHSLPERPEVW